ncbi:MAG: HDOD domain-containing protein [Planctomycetaceae bacterium]|nr:HDOD domain-containing protein [Planctomycetaceae bacterium]
MSVVEKPKADDSLNWARLRATALESIREIELPGDLQIPALPQAVTEFSERASDPNVEIKELAAIVSTSTGLTFELLKYVNSAVFALSSPVRDVGAAIAKIGIGGARTYLIAAGMKAANSAMNSRLMNQRVAWNEGLQKALFARAVAKTLRIDEGLSFMGGLLQDFLLLALTNHFYGDYIRFLETDARDGRDLADWELEQFGWTHATAGAYVAHKWRFPDDLLCAIYYHHSLRDTLNNPEVELFKLFPVTLSGLLPDQVRQSARGIADLIAVDGRCSALKLDELCRAVDEEQMQMADGVETPESLLRIIQEARQSMK